MKPRTGYWLLAASVGLLVFTADCTQQDPGSAMGTGGATASGGTTASGGAPSTGGNGNSGNPTGTGGMTSTGGNTGSGGSMSTGGSIGTGGATGTAGKTGVAGKPGGTGGAATGGSGAGGLAGLTSAVENDGTDCTIAALPETASLPTNAKLPDPFKKLDGTRMTTKAEWHCRREEIVKMEEKYVYGVKPPPPMSVTGTVTSTMITINVTDNGKSSSFTAGVKLPTGGTAPYPVIVEYATDNTGTFGPPLDTAVLNSEGVAVIYYNAYSVGAEGNGHGANQKGAFYSLYSGGSATSLLTAWGWGVSRIIDVIAKSGGSILRAEAVGVSGCSRFGKGAFLAGVLDQRVVLTMPVESGTAGVPIWRGIPGEGAQTLSSAYGEQPWFADAFSAFTSSPTKTPLDTHELVAMVAPRGLFIMDNPHIANLGPKSASVAALAGAEVYKALGVGENITYYSDVQSGTHCSMRPEWSAPLKSNIDKFLKKTGNDPGVMKISASAAGKLSDWSDWTTPTLN